MEQHAIPRQITTFEFKLIGFLTLKQFIYIIVAAIFGVGLYFIFPLPIFNILFAAACVLFGLALAFFPVNERPLDVWIKNLIKRLRSPTQFTYKKSNSSIDFLSDLVFVSDPHRTVAHIESKEKLTAYLASKQSKNQAVQKAQTNIHAINTLLQKPLSELNPQKTSQPINQVTSQQANQITSQPVDSAGEPSNQVTSKPVNPFDKLRASQVTSQRIPFLTGIVKNHKLMPIPGILIYIKDRENNVLRLLKTNINGIFATMSPLPPDEYVFEIKDPKGMFFFDTMNMKLEPTNPIPLEFFSKELF
jgi:hypothetical protein